MAEFSRLLQPVPIDPLAEQRRLAEQLAKNPLEDYARVVKQLAEPSDLFAAQRQAMEALFPKDPLARYNQIVKGFAAVTGGAIATPPIVAPEGTDASQGTDAAPFSLPSRTMILHLLAIASVCVWLIAGGVSAERLQVLMIDALILANHLSKSE